MNHSLFDPETEREHPQPNFSTLLAPSCRSGPLAATGRIRIERTYSPPSHDRWSNIRRVNDRPDLPHHPDATDKKRTDATRASTPDEGDLADARRSLRGRFRGSRLVEELMVQRSFEKP